MATLSRSTGMIPLPLFPVDSASSCSSHAPRSEIPGDARIVRRGDSGATGVNHFFSAIQKLQNINAHHRSRDHAEIRQCGIAAANTRDTGEDVAEVIIFGHVLHFGAGISDSDEAISSFLLA